MLRGVIIEESLQDVSVLKTLHIESTEVEQVTPDHQTPWVKQWTMHHVAILPENGQEVATEISNALDPEHNWYADFKDNTHHYIVFRKKVFVVDRSKPEQYEAVTAYGISLGIPEYQVDFSPAINEWKR